MPPLQIPGQLNIGYTHSSGPLAQPVAVTNSGPQGIHTYVWGGFSQRLQLAAMLAQQAHSLILHANINAQHPGSGRPVPQPTSEELAAAAFELADAFLLHEAQLIARERAADPATRPAIAN